MDQKEKRTKDTLFFIQFAFVCLVMLFVLSTAVVLMAAKRPTVSEVEKRSLASFPSFTWKSIWDGSFTEGLSLYYNDTVPNRDTLKKISSQMLDWTGIRIDDVKIYNPGKSGGENDVILQPTEKPAETENPTQEPTATDPNATQTPTPVKTPTPTPTPAGQDEPVVEYENQGILIYKNRGMELFGGTLERCRIYAESLNQYKKDLGNDVRVYSMNIPIAAAYYLPDKYAKRSESQPEKLDYIKERFSGVEYVDAYNALLQHTSEDIYLRTDHHWSPLGAYYATQEFAKTAGVPFADLSAYEKETVPGYVGTLYTFTQDKVLLNNPEDFVYYKTKTSYHVSYYDKSFLPVQKADSLFFKTSVSESYTGIMGSDELCAHIEGPNKNGRTLIIVRDSFGRPIAPYLTGSFEHIYVLDLRYFTLNGVQFMKDHGATDVLFAHCIFTSTGSHVKYFEQLRTQ